MADSDNFFEMVRRLVNDSKACTFMTLTYGDEFEVDAEILVLRVKNKRTGEEQVLSAPAGFYPDPPDTLPASDRLH